MYTVCLFMKLDLHYIKPSLAENLGLMHADRLFYYKLFKNKVGKECNSIHKSSSSKIEIIYSDNSVLIKQIKISLGCFKKNRIRKII